MQKETDKEKSIHYDFTSLGDSHKELLKTLENLLNLGKFK